MPNSVKVYDSGDILVAEYATIQAAISDSSTLSGYKVVVSDGVYNENVVINKSITLVSENGRANTTISGVAGSQLGTIEIDPNTNGVTIGGIDQGFTILGLNGNGATEKSAIYIQGSNSNLQILDNEIVAQGDAGLMSESSAVITHVLIDGNTFSGQTFVGANPEGSGFGGQFATGNNVPRQLVVLGNGGSGPYTSHDITFSNNIVSGTAGGDNTSGGEQGNTLVTIDAADSLIADNTLTGFTNRFAAAVRARGPNTDFIDNTIDQSVNHSDSQGFSIDNKGTPGTYSGNVIIGDNQAGSDPGETDDDLAAGTPGDDSFIGNAGDDAFSGLAGDDTFDGSDGNDSFDGGDGSDTATFADATTGVSVSLAITGAQDTGGAGTDTLVNVENLLGSAHDDALTGDAQANNLSSGLGSDTLDGGSGIDSLAGEAGNDTYVVDDTLDAVTEAPGGGVDTVLSSASSYTLAANVENLTLVDPASNVEDFEDFALGTITNGENEWTLNGNASRDQEVITDPDDPLNQVFRMSSDPSSGDFAGPYTPALSATSGEPQTTADYDSMQVTFTVEAIAPGDNSRLEVDFGIDPATDRNNFMVIENTAAGIRVATNEPLVDGNWYNNSFTAFTGNRTIVSGLDNTVEHQIQLVLHYLDGSNNDIIDIYVDGVLAGQTTTFENYREFAVGQDQAAAAEANQTSRLFFRPSAGGAPQDGPGGQNQGFLFDDISYSVFDSGSSGTGNALDNAITGNSADNVLSGLAGDDTLSGGVGHDTLDGGEDNDNLQGGAANDSIDGGDGNDVVDGGSGDDTGYLGAGNDTFTDGDGGADTITGGLGDDSIDGGTGVDSAILSGPFADYSITIDASVTVTDQVAGNGNDGTDHLVNIETLQFADVDVLIVGAGGYSSIQAAIDAASDGDIILVGTGTYAENLTVDKEVTIRAAGTGPVILKGTLTTNPPMGSGDHVDEFFEANNPTSYSGGTGIAITADNVTIDGLTITGFVTGIDLGTSDGVTIVNNVFTDNIGGIRKGTAANVTDADISDNTFEHGIFGMTIYAASDGTGAFENVTIDDNNFSALSEKGMYFEQLGNASLTGNIFDDVGNFGRLSGSFGGTLGNFGNAIDVNLKYETYANVTFTDTVITNSGYSNQNGNAGYGANGGAISIKTRDDAPSYNSAPASFSGQIVFQGGSIDGTSTAFRLGEPGKNNHGPNVLIDDVHIENTALSDIDNATHPNAGGIATVNMEDTQTDLDASVSQAPVDVTGNALANLITGGSGSDSLAGNAGNDTLIGGLGNDSLDGGNDSDAASYATASSGVLVDLNELGAQNTLGAGIDVLNGIEDLIGSSFGDFFTGNAVNNRLDGGDGADVLSGEAGNDTLLGHDGDDDLDGGLGNDSIDGGVGTDIARYISASSAVKVSLAIAAAQNTLGAGTDTLVSIENLDGSLYNDSLTGNGSANLLLGNVGNDSLSGGAGNDSLGGGFGNDTLEGGAGNDSLDGGNDSDWATYGTATAAVTVSLVIAGAQDTGGAGEDTLVNIENLIGSAYGDSLIGNGSANSLSGGDGNDTLDGGAGADSLIGGNGNDVFYVDTASDKTSETSSGGIDKVFAGANYTLNSYIEDLTLTGSTISGTGNGMANHIDGNTANNILDGASNNDTISGGDGNDTLLGGASNDFLMGDNGADSLDGGTGADTMAGGAGNDSYVIDQAGEIVTELSTGNIDTIYASVNRTLDAYVENLILTGSAINGTGNGLANIMTGNASDNILSGAANNDTIDGAAGNDSLVGDAGSDSLIGGLASDTLWGGAGTDVLSGGDGADYFLFTGSNNTDTIADFTNGIDKIWIAGYAEALNNFADLNISVVSGNTVINLSADYPNAGKIVLSGITSGIDASDFLFS